MTVGSHQLPDTPFTSCPATMTQNRQITQLYYNAMLRLNSSGLTYLDIAELHHNLKCDWLTVRLQVTS